MATVTVLYRFADNECLQVSVEAESSYPDAVDQARIEALHAYEGALEITLAQMLPGDGDGDD